MRATRRLAAITAALAFAMAAGPPGAAALAPAAGTGHGGQNHASRGHGGQNHASRGHGGQNHGSRGHGGQGHGSRHHRATGSVGHARGRDAEQGGAQLASRGTVVNYPAAGHVRRLPRVRASAFVVADARTGQVLAARDAHGWYRPASTLKVLTAITLIPVLNPHATTVASHEAATTEPNDVGLKAGRRYRISGLFRALLTISANDAAVALAQATGSLRRGVALMNAEARRLRADDTVAKDPNGLDARGQHTSAYDEALIARRALAMPAFLKYDQTQSALFDIKPRHRVGLVNQNLMLTRYRGDLGGKLGWTDAAGATYVGMARRHHVTLIVALLHCPPLTEFTYATRLLNWGFAVDGEVRPVGALAGPRSAAPAGPPRPAAPADHPAAPAKAAATPQLAASGGPGADRTTMAVGFLVAAGLIVLGFVLSARRSVVRSRSGRG